MLLHTSKREVPGNGLCKLGVCGRKSGLVR